MNDLKHIATVLRSLGITIEKIDFFGRLGPGDMIKIDFKYKDQIICKSYTIEEIRSELITNARTQPEGPQRLDRIAARAIRRIKSG